MFSSSGLIQILTPDKLGVYTLANALFSDRLAYVKETGAELSALISIPDPSNEEYMGWIVRYEIDSSR